MGDVVTLSRASGQRVVWITLTRRYGQSNAGGADVQLPASAFRQLSIGSQQAYPPAGGGSSSGLPPPSSIQEPGARNAAEFNNSSAVSTVSGPIYPALLCFSSKCR